MVNTLTNKVLEAGNNERRGSGGSRRKKKENQEPVHEKVPSNTICKICSKEIEGGSFVGCDNCLTWLHLECSQVPQIEFEFLHKHKTTQLLYHCSLCKKGSKDDHTEAQNVKIERLTEMVQTISNQNLAILELLKKDNIVEVKIEDTVQESIHTNLKELLDDQSEKDNKKNNLIIFNLPESEGKDDGISAESKDLDKVKEILNFIDKDIITPEADLSEKSISRIGNTKSNDISRPRPVKIEFPNQRPKNRAMRNARNLRDFNVYPKKIGISKDKSEAEMKKDRALRWKLVQKRKDGQDWTIYDDDVVLRKDIPKLRQEKEDKKGGSREQQEGDLSIIQTEEGNLRGHNKEGDLKTIQTNGGNLTKQIKKGDPKIIQNNGGDLTKQDKEGDLKIIQNNGGNLTKSNKEGDLKNIQNNGGDLNSQKEGGDIMSVEGKVSPVKDTTTQMANGGNSGAPASEGKGGDSGPKDD